MADRNDEIYAGRVEKAERLRALGIDPYPIVTGRTHSAAAAVAALERVEAASEESGPEATVAGRITALRDQGRLTFVDLRDGSGRIQVMLRANQLGADTYALLRQFDLGDFMRATGTLIRTRTGEPTVQASDFAMLAKALQPPPEKFHGLTDVEQRYRRRYLDLIANDEVRRIFRARSAVVAAMRRFLDGRGFIEVETPVLVAESGGAAARPFKTFFNALDEERALRIATELHLKRLVVGGLDKVYEIGRIFRNEGISTKHNPEFTMLESYEAYADYRDVAMMVEEMVATIAQEVFGSKSLPYRGGTIDFTPPWQRRTMRELLIEHGGLDFEQFRSEEMMRAELRRRGIDAPPSAPWSKLLDEAWSTLVEPHLIQPVFVLDYPVELSPLAKQKPDDSSLVERFEAFAGGFEIANAYSELNDPLEQRRRFEEQLRNRDRGDDEAELVDEDFLFALEHGLPPTGGLGMGIDRLMMVLADQASIREVILFPQMRAERPAHDSA